MTVPNQPELRMYLTDQMNFLQRKTQVELMIEMG
jgi:hypothetical protein